MNMLDFENFIYKNWNKMLAVWALIIILNAVDLATTLDAFKLSGFQAAIEQNPFWRNLLATNSISVLIFQKMFLFPLILLGIFYIYPNSINKHWAVRLFGITLGLTILLAFVYVDVHNIFLILNGSFK